MLQSRTPDSIPLRALFVLKQTLFYFEDALGNFTKAVSFQLGCEDNHVGQCAPSSWVDLQVTELEAVLCLHLGVGWCNASILLHDVRSEPWVQS